MKRFNRWFAAPVVFGALVVFSGCFAQTEPAPTDGNGDGNEEVGEVQSAYIGQSCNIRQSPNGGCTGTPSGTCCVTNPTTGAGSCVDLQNNKFNCGTCGHVCGSGSCSDVCIAGACDHSAC